MPKMTVSVEAINIAGARSYSYNETELRYGEIQYYGRTLLFGARVEF
jgi:hypothetical protein